MKAQILKAAIGERDGDYVTLSNAWAKVTITYNRWAPLPRGSGIRPAAGYTVSGDTVAPDGKGNGGERSFVAIVDAYAYAINSLVAFQHGRAD